MPDLLDLAVKRIGRPTDEIDDAFRRILLRVLEVDDDRLFLAQVVGNLLCIIK